MDEQHRGSTSSINFDILSVGTADAQPIGKYQASVIDHAGTRTTTPHDEMQQHILPELGPSLNLELPSPISQHGARPSPRHDTLSSPNFSGLSPLRSRPLSTGMIEDLRLPQPKRRSIIDPATVRLSFAGSVSDIGSPLVLPLEEGLQKLYKLYNEHTNPAIPLPHTLPITEVPLTTIADALSHHIKAQSIALLDCAKNLHNVTNLHEKLKQDLVTLEQHYSLAVEKSNVVAMSTNDVRCRLGWQIEEIIRINTEKEVAIDEAAYCKNEAQRLSDEMQQMAEMIQENERLMQENKILREGSRLQDEEAERLESELDEVKLELKEVKKKLESVPKQITKLYGKFADNGRERKKLERRNTKRKDLRTGLLIPASPMTNGNVINERG